MQLSEIGTARFPGEPASVSVSIHHLPPVNLSLGFCLVWGGGGQLLLLCVLFWGRGEGKGKVGADGGGEQGECV